MTGISQPVPWGWTGAGLGFSEGLVTRWQALLRHRKEFLITFTIIFMDETCTKSFSKSDEVEKTLSTMGFR